MFDRLEKELVPGKTKHLLLLLGVPIGMIQVSNNYTYLELIVHTHG